MRTRRSNRNKSYAIEKYDFESSSDENKRAAREKKRDSLVKRRKAAEDKDENFQEAAAAEDLDATDIAIEPSDDDVVSGASISDEETRRKTSRRKSARTSKRAASLAADSVVDRGEAEYLDVEPLTHETRLLRPYCGPVERYARGRALIKGLYGARQETLEVVQKMLDRWVDWTVLPPKGKDETHGLRDKNMWTPDLPAKEERLGEEWMQRVRQGVPGAFATSTLSEEEATPYRLPQRPMTVIVGAYESQREICFKPGDRHALSQSGLPYDQDEGESKVPAGWMLDTGGLVVSMDWASRPAAGATQLLALAVIPHADQEPYNYESEASKPDFEKYGAVQIWGFEGGDVIDGYKQPSMEKPKLRKTLCFEGGRGKRVKWSPYGDNLAVVCGDGSVHVVHAGQDDMDGNCGSVQSPIAILQLGDEHGIKGTCMTWVSINRLAVGYSDGSIVLWSIYPTHMLSRHPVHHNSVVDIASGYPATPYVVASQSVAGKTKVFDLRAPSYEIAEAAQPSVTLQHNLLSYSDHLLGFLALYPSVVMMNTSVGFLQCSQFPLVRRVFIGDDFLTCLSAGRTHPYMLIGCADGTLWAMNPQSQIFAKNKERMDRLRIFQHEHRPATIFPPEAAAVDRGASRIIQGFSIEKNRRPHSSTRVAGRGKKGKKDEGMGEDDDEGTSGLADPTVYEPLTRITAVEWNPNDGYGCWAAAAMGSGLVRVMDLGLERRL